LDSAGFETGKIYVKQDAGPLAGATWEFFFTFFVFLCDVLLSFVFILYPFFLIPFSLSWSTYCLAIIGKRFKVSTSLSVRPLTRNSRRRNSGHPCDLEQMATRKAERSITTKSNQVVRDWDLLIASPRIPPFT